MSTYKSILYKMFKEFIKKFSDNKNKNKNHKLDKNKNFQSSGIQLKNKFKYNKYFNGKCNYYYKHGYKSQDCHTCI